MNNMKLLYLDCFAGISGDMFLGALLDLGLSEDVLRTELEKLHLPGYRISSRRVTKQNISATKFDVVVIEDAAVCFPSPKLHAGIHEHRGYAVIAAMIQESGLFQRVEDRASDPFRPIGRAE